MRKIVMVFYYVSFSSSYSKVFYRKYDPEISVNDQEGAAGLLKMGGYHK